MRRFLPILLLAAAILAAHARPARAQVPSQQVPSRPLQAYVKPRLGFTQYTGENSPALLVGPCTNATLGCPRSSYGIGLEAGLYVSPTIGASLAYQTASYSSIAALDAAPRHTRNYRVRSTVQVLTQYRFPDLSSYVMPYVQAGMQVTTGHTPLRNEGPQGPIQIVERWAFGPSFTAGLDVPIGRHLAVFAEVTTNVAFPDDAIDGHGGFIGMDRLSWAGLGLKIQNLSLPARFSPPRPASPTPSVPSTASAPSTLAVNEMGHFELTPGSPTDQQSLRFQWVFSDGTVREGRTVTKQFASPGSYEVNVYRAAADAKDEPLHTFQVRVRPAAQPLEVGAIAVSSDTLRPGQPITFEPTIRSGTPVEFRWDFGDGTVAFARAPSHTYAEPGRYEVILTVVSTAGRASQHHVVEVNTMPAAPRETNARYAVQLGAFSKQARADRFARRHTSRLPKPPVVQHDTQTGYYRVELPYTREAKAQAVLRQVRRDAPFADAFLRESDTSAYEVADRDDSH